jgi:hypothetical protein
MRSFRVAVLAASVATLVVAGIPASAGHKEDPRTKNLHPLGHIVEPAGFEAGQDPDIHTDIAFWENLAIQGNWDGFNIRDISSPGNPKQISRTFCNGNQGDVVVWDNVVVRSWNAPAGASPLPFGTGTTCDGETVAAGFEGLHVFDISNLADPVLVAQVATPCGSHTATGVPDLEGGRLLIYNSPSSGACPGIGIVEVPLDAPEDAAFLGQINLGRSCHDTGVILGNEMIGACAGGNGFTLFNIPSLDAPAAYHSQVVPGVTIGHSAAFTWDGEVLIFGHEPGGGVGPRCDADDPPSDRTFFFYDTDDATDDGTATGTLLGTWTLQRLQDNTQNCTLHNYNLVPLPSGNDVITHGSYQSGTSLVDMTDVTAATELAWSDPPSLGPGSFCDPDGAGPAPPTCQLGGAWSSYWYNGFVYETNITEGLNVFRFSGNETAGALKLDHLNPQTQEFTLG